MTHAAARPAPRLVRAELRKLRTVRSSRWLLGGLVAFVAVGVAEPLVSAPREAFRVPLEAQPFLSAAGLVVTVFALVAGLRLATDDLRHGAIVPALLVTPVRRRLVAAKTTAAALVGAGCAAIGGVVALGTGITWLASQGLPVHGSAGAVAGWALGLGLVGASWAVLGVGVGLLIRHQAPAMVAAFVWLLAVETLIGALLADVQRFLPGAAGRAVVATFPTDLGAGAAAVVLGAWAAVAAVAGGLAFDRRDVA